MHLDVTSSSLLQGTLLLVAAAMHLVTIFLLLVVRHLVTSSGAQGAPLRTRSRALNGKGAIVPQGPSGEVTQLCCWPRNGAPCHLDWFLGVRFILNYILS